MLRYSFKKYLIMLPVAFLALPQLVWARISNDPKSFQAAYEQAGVFRAWDYVTGSSDVVVAIIDNGFDTFHPDLAANVWKNNKEIPDNKIDDDKNDYVDDIWGWNFLDNNNNPQPPVANLTAEEREDAVFNHGTIVAGIIGAVGNNNRDGAGVNWRVRLMNLRVLGNSGFGELSPLGKAIRYAADNGAHIINISMVGDKDEDMLDAIRYASEKGVVIVAAVGNYGGNLNNNLKYPTCTDADSDKVTVLGVSAIGIDRRLAIFSNIGSKCVDITAPGADIASTIRYSPSDRLAESYKRGWQGTSFAAPFVSGAAALVKSIRPEWKAPDIYQALLSTVHHTPADDEADYANMYGKGLLQVHRAVAYALGLPLPPTLFEAKTTDTTAPSPIIGVKKQKIFSLIYPGGELRDIYRDSAEFGSSYERDEVKKIESLSTIGVGREQKIVTARIKNKTERLISVYNYKWQEQASWTVPVTGPVHVSVFERDLGLTVAVSPITENTQLYWLYDSSGKMLESISEKTKHNGVRVLGHGDGLYVIVARADNKKKSVDLIYYKNGSVVNKFSLPDYVALPSAVMGDIIGDNKSELVLGSADTVAIHLLDGSVVRAFAPFGDGKSDGVNVSLLDANDDGAIDIVTTAVRNPGEIRAWNARAKPAGVWSLPKPPASLFILPRK